MAKAKMSAFEKKDKAADKKAGVKENSAKDKKIDLKKSVMPSSAKLNAGIKAKVVMTNQSPKTKKVTVKNKKQKGAVASPKITKITKF